MVLYFLVIYLRPKAWSPSPKRCKYFSKAIGGTNILNHMKIIPLRGYVWLVKETFPPRCIKYVLCMLFTLHVNRRSKSTVN